MLQVCIFTVNMCNIRATNSPVVNSLRVDGTNVLPGQDLKLYTLSSLNVDV